MRAQNLFPLATLLSLAACAPITHTAKLPSSAQEVTFVGGRLNGAPVESETFDVDGKPWKLEHSAFVYEIAAPFQSVEFVAGAVPADEHESGRPDPKDLPALFQATQQGLLRTAPDLRCEQAKPDAASGGYVGECALSRDGVDYRMRMRVAPSPRGLTLQLASWVSPRGKALIEQFWTSLSTSPGPELATKSLPSSSSVTLAARLVATSVGSTAQR
jgi:hypothetical protein